MFEDKILGRPFQVTAKVGDAYRLDLPTTLKVLNEFHPSLLRKDPVIRRQGA